VDKTFQRRKLLGNGHIFSGSARHALHNELRVSFFMKILLIEDEKKIASFVRKGLEAQGFVVDASHDGDEGFIAATTRPYDAIVLDIMLPGRDGLSILRSLRERRMAVPVILLTARGELNERLEGLNLGADDYLTKPFTLRNSSPVFMSSQGGPPDRVIASLKWRISPSTCSPAKWCVEGGKSS
jgi:CheY-like chemotaxis protein